MSTIWSTVLSHCQALGIFWPIARRSVEKTDKPQNPSGLGSSQSNSAVHRRKHGLEIKRETWQDMYEMRDEKGQERKKKGGGDPPSYKDGGWKHCGSTLCTELMGHGGEALGMGGRAAIIVTERGFTLGLE